MSGLKENFLFAKRIFSVKWKITIIDVIAAAIAKPTLPYAKRQIGIPIFPVFGRINGGRSLNISFPRILRTKIPKIPNIPTYKNM